MGIKFWLVERKRDLTDEWDFRFSFIQSIGLAKGLQQSKMKWYYTTDEAFGKIREKFKNSDEQEKEIMDTDQSDQQT